jgi:hypothetical protein
VGGQTGNKVEGMKDIRKFKKNIILTGKWIYINKKDR